MSDDKATPQSDQSVRDDPGSMEEKQEEALLEQVAALDDEHLAKFVGLVETMEVIEQVIEDPAPIAPPPGMSVDRALVDAIVEALRPVIGEEVERAMIRVQTSQSSQEDEGQSW